MNQLTMEEIKFLNEKAKNIRIDILKAIMKKQKISESTF